MAGPAPAWSSRLAIQLVRGLPGTLHLHRRTVRALGLRKVNQIVFRENSPTIRGMINQVKRLLSVETEEMYKARLQAEAQHLAQRPPIVVNHSPPSPSAS
ncbi:large subunit ribosomal protein L30 [Marchantia polymorpha subsp. ruderalis]|uniref:Large ribosomal subunit protein uL30m n=2 Tax=Marchantia polymorpha TaxID=3197 RepID=A0AAF6BKG8_MARPO|nr:hypothetical protein MARPO_0058s0042 [Marchantia polymorpha]BBN12502.1 hypothetical protein Mp_5g20640 [Marchantia polymorpha subsp. ruderalis]|eukprot:PTQ37254.1 hypothetical protein MARPO_0058s0042 [Marchantia polymorpha]